MSLTTIENTVSVLAPYPYGYEILKRYSSLSVVANLIKLLELYSIIFEHQDVFRNIRKLGGWSNKVVRRTENDNLPPAAATSWRYCNTSTEIVLSSPLLL